MAQLHQRLAQVEEQLKKKVRSEVFCYRCGLENHMAFDCTNPPNKALVNQKREARRKKFAEKNY